MPRRVRKKPSLLSPAGNLIKRLSDTDARFRRRILKGSICAVAALFAVSLLFGTYSLPRIARLQLQKGTLVESNRRLSAELVDAIRMRNMLSSDRGYIEEIARTHYYMVRPNETIYRYRGR